jgi:hypothetical protein
MQIIPSNFYINWIIVDVSILYYESDTSFDF